MSCIRSRILPSLAILLCCAHFVAAQPQSPQPQVKSARVDAFGDPLPADAVLRLGALRFRHSGEAMTTAYSPDGRLLAVSQRSGKVILFDADSGKTVRLIQIACKDKNFLTGVYGFDFSPDGKMMAIHAGYEIQLITVATAKLVRTLGPVGIQPEAAIGLTRFTSCGNYLITSDNAVGAAVFDLRSGKHIHTMKGQKHSALYDFAISADSKMAALASHKHVYLRDLRTGKLLRKFGTSAGFVGAIAFSPDCKTIASHGGNRLVLSETATGIERAVLHGKSGMGLGLAFTPDGKMLISAGQDGKLVIWDVDKKKCRHELDSRMWIGRSFAMTRNGKRVAMGTVHNVIRQWDVATGKERFPHLTKGHDAAVQSVAFSPDGKIAATGGKNQKIFLWEAKTGKMLHHLKGHSAVNVAFSPDGSRLATIWPYNKHVRIWNSVTGNQLFNLPHPNVDSVNCIAYSSDGKIIVTGCWQRSNEHTYGITTVNVWHAITRKLLRSFSIPNMQPETICIAGDNRTAAIGGGDLNRLIWLADLQAGAVTMPLNGHKDFFNNAVFTPDDHLLITTGTDQAVRIWEVVSGQEIIALEGHQRVVGAIAVSPNGRIIASGGGHPSYTSRASRPQRIRIWDAATGKELYQLSGHNADVNALAFSPDGKRLLSGLQDSTALIWDLSKKPQPKLTESNLRPTVLTDLWRDLAASADKAYRAVHLLSTAPRQAVPFLSKRVQPTPAADPKQVQRWIIDLDSDSFAVRTKAIRRLSQLGVQVESTLKKALKTNPTLEAHLRMEKLLKDIRGVPPTETLRSLRAVWALERMDTPAAREYLQRLAKGATDARVTRAARAALRRLQS